MSSQCCKEENLLEQSKILPVTRPQILKYGENRHITHNYQCIFINCKRRFIYENSLKDHLKNHKEQIELIQNKCKKIKSKNHTENLISFIKIQTCHNIHLKNQLMFIDKEINLLQFLLKCKLSKYG